MAHLSGAFSLVPWPWRSLPIMAVSLPFVLVRIIIKPQIVLVLAESLVALRARPPEARQRASTTGFFWSHLPLSVLSESLEGRLLLHLQSSPYSNSDRAEKEE